MGAYILSAKTAIAFAHTAYDNCAIVRRGETLYTFNAQCPEVRWAEDGAALRSAAASFALMAQRK